MPPRRVCLEPGCRERVYKGRCPEHELRRPPQAARGYGREHWRLRAQWQRLVDGGLARCRRCGGAILPGERWDLGHVDGRKDAWWGPEHPSCNRTAAGRSRLYG